MVYVCVCVMRHSQNGSLLSVATSSKAQQKEIFVWGFFIIPFRAAEFEKNPFQVSRMWNGCKASHCCVHKTFYSKLLIGKQKTSN